MSIRRTVKRMYATSDGLQYPSCNIIESGYILLYNVPNMYDKYAAIGGQSILHQGCSECYVYHWVIGLLIVIDIQFLCAQKSPKFGQSPLPEYDPSPTQTLSMTTTNIAIHSEGTDLKMAKSGLFVSLSSSAVLCCNLFFSNSIISMTLNLGDHSSSN